MRSLLVIASLVSLALAGCTSSEDPDLVTPPMDSQGRYVITVGGPDADTALSFTPAKAKVPAGATVVWKLAGTIAHDVQADDGLFDSGDIGGLDQTGEEYAFTFTTTGTFPYFCEQHGKASMSGTITVG